MQTSERNKRGNAVGGILNQTSFHPRKNEYMYHIFQLLFSALDWYSVLSLFELLCQWKRLAINRVLLMIICGKTLNKSKIYNYYSMNSSCLIIKHQLFHVVITFPYTLILYTIYCCRCSLRWVGCNTDHLCLFWIHGFQCNLQEYCPYQQKNIFDIYHCFIGCNVDNVYVSMIFGS